MGGPGSGNPNPSPETRFKPGDRANPGGRPKGRSLVKLLRRMISEPGRKRPSKEEMKALSDAEVIIMRLITGARRGDLGFIKEILDRLEGKPVPVQPKASQDLRSITELLPGPEGGEGH